MYSLLVLYVIAMADETDESQAAYRILKTDLRRAEMLLQAANEVNGTLCVYVRARARMRVIFLPVRSLHSLVRALT